MDVNPEVAQSGAIPPDMNPVQAGMVQLLTDRLWHWFVTLTYRTNIKSTEKVEKDFRDWLFVTVAEYVLAARPELVEVAHQKCFSLRHRRHYIHKFYRGKFPKSYEKLRAWCTPQWALGIEEHKSGYLHAHALVWLPPQIENMLRRDAWQLWYEKHGSARVKPPDVNQAVAAYVAKYVTKDGMIILSPNYNRLSRDLGSTLGPSVADWESPINAETSVVEARGQRTLLAC